ncbi:substrate-binding domain-containing protein [Litorihabitans aurantiacus]|uniref:Transcriptional regulator LacI/GalR-like sensor domain-containing protein n=1 Tax=Litorihabitans aurantiacus TaxID=1930061 RepID=A0AA37XHX6_9MICO|nr:substrate-binding domain-containing protein [Litorihabitans aurantiacus]GMA33247.1 hypothetical protein GCM10025875_32390 [Litorihabitans aurantiacus]
MEHLLDHGHRTVTHVRGPAASLSADRREEGWRSVLLERGRDVPAVVDGDWTASSGYLAGARIAEDPSVTAVYASNDEMALGVVRALHERGRRVPQDVSVVGFDDVAGADNFLPPLTTVRQDFAEVGRRSVRHLVEQIERGRRTSGVELVPATLVERQSVASPSR